MTLLSTFTILDPTDGQRTRDFTPSGDNPLDASEFMFAAGWTDGLPVVPCTPERLEEFLAHTTKDPDDVLVAMPHLNRQCTVREAAINAVMAGCRPEYFPVVIAAWESLEAHQIGPSALWQSTTGSAPMLIVNGPIIEELGINNAGNVFGSGFRANASIGRAIRLASLNVFHLRPHLLDQATQGSPAKYSCCIAENEAVSPWQPYHVEHGHAPESSTVTALLIRGTLPIEARHTGTPEQLLLDITNSAARTGRLIGSNATICLVLGPEHAALLGEANWSKEDIKTFIHEHSLRSSAEFDRVGKGAVSKRSGWRVPKDHPDAIPPENTDAEYIFHSPAAIEVLVSGADNAGVSTIVETMGLRTRRPATIEIERIATT